MTNKCLADRSCVTFVSDANYLPILATSLISLRTFLTGKVDIAVFLVEVPAPQKKDIEAFFQNLGLDIYWIDLDLTSPFGQLDLLPATLNRITRATFGRLIINDILSGFDQHLYLDGDTLVLSNISELFEVNCPKFAAVDAGWGLEAKREFFERNGVSPRENYFNAGVYLLNAANWRETGATKTCIEMAISRSHYLPLADQDVLNLVFGGDCVWLDRKWNFKKEQSWQTPKLAPGIVHFAGRLRPWDELDRRAPAVVRALYQRVFAVLPRSIMGALDSLELNEAEKRRARKTVWTRQFSARARRESWNPQHNAVLKQSLKSVFTLIG